MAGKVVAEGRLEATIASRFAIDEGTDIGMDRGSPVLQRCIGQSRYSAFDGTIKKITLQVYPEEKGSDQ